MQLDKHHLTPSSSRLVVRISGAALLAALAASPSACGSERAGFDAAAGAGAGACNTCRGQTYTRCEGDTTRTEDCPLDAACVDGLGCVPCPPGKSACVGDEVHACTGDGKAGDLVEKCDPAKGMMCSNGKCVTGCEAAAESESNVGCEFWAVDLDQSDGPTDPASAPWALILSNASSIPSTVRIELNDAPVGSPPQPSLYKEVTVGVDDLVQVDMPIRELDCGSKPNDHAAPGTCLTSNAFRVSSTAPIVVYQFNNVVHNYSTDASLLLPTPVLGKLYRNVGWASGSPFPTPVAFVQRSFVTVVGTQAGTHVKVRPSWRIKGHAQVPATPKGGTIAVTLGPFDVLNLESDDGTMGECAGPTAMKSPYCTDLTGTVVEADKPVAVFTGTESSGVGAPEDAPKPPTWTEDSGCCKQHLEEQLPPLHAAGKKFVVTRSPVRTTLSEYKEPDVLRFVGAAASASVKTNLPPPLDSFQLLPGQIIETWTDHDIVVDASEPILVAQYLVMQDMVGGVPKGDPSFTIFPPVEQSRTEYVFLSPKGWSESWVVISAEASTVVKVDGSVPSDCIVAPAGVLGGKSYEARRCPLSTGVHRLSGSAGFGVMAYGYGDADAYSFAGGAYVKKIYEPPPIDVH